MLTNYHTHHHFCRHAVGNVEDYVKQAIAENFDIIGISDHSPLSVNKDNMTEVEFELYLKEIEACQIKYKDKIKILKALEIEYFDDLHDEYQKFKERLDYLILAPHDYDYNGNLYCAFFIQNDEMLTGYFETLIKGIKSGFFKFSAHPDLFLNSYHFNDLAKTYTKKLAEVCLEEDFILEFNANGLRKGKMHIMGEYRNPYPYMPFWETIKDYQVKVIVNSDCHNPLALNDKYFKNARELAKSIGLNVLSTI